MAPATGFFRDLTPRLVYVAVVGSLGGMSFGYDNGWWGFILGAAQFNQDYGSVETCTAAGVCTRVLSGQQQSIGTGLGTTGIMIGCMIAPYLNEWRGRKFMFFSIAIVSIIGTLIQSLSVLKHSFAVLIVGKVILNAGVGLAAAVVSGYLAEVAPGSLRGAMVMQYNVMQNVGYVVAAGAVYGVIYRTDKLNYLIPIVVQFGLPTIMLILSPFLPESPRWLVSKGRLGEAAENIMKLRGGKNNVDEAVVLAEVEEIRAAYEDIKKLHEGNGWLELFRGNNLRRTMVAVGLQSLQQAQGVSFVSNYLIITFIGLGITNVYSIVLGLYVELFLASSFGTYLTDKLGRRFLLLTGGTIQACCMIVSASICAHTTSPTGSLANLLIATFFIWVAVFAVSWSPVPWAISAEISSNPLREKTLALAAWSGFAVGLIVGFVTPYIQNAEYGNLGGMIGFVWGGFSVISVIYAYFLVPEMKGRTLEELDYMFESGLSARAFAKFDSTELLAEKHAEHNTQMVTKPMQLDASKRGEQKHVENAKRFTN